MTHNLEPGGRAWEISRGNMQNQMIQPVLACEGEVKKITSRAIYLKFGEREKSFSAETGESLSKSKSGFKGLWKQEVFDSSQMRDMISDIESKGFFEFQDGTRGTMDAKETERLKRDLGM